MTAATCNRPRRKTGGIAILALLWPALVPAASKPVTNVHYYPIPHVMKCQVHLPAAYDPAREYPLLIALHGSGGSPELFDRLWGKGARAQCLLAAPEGPYVLPFAQRRDIPGHSWFLQVQDRRIWAMADPLAVQAMVATAAEVKANYKVGRVFVLGFSQGASLAYQAALRYPGIFSGVLAVAGLFPAESLTLAELNGAVPTLRVFIAHGTRDAVVKPAASERARSFLEKAGFQVTFRSFRGGHELPAELFRDILAWIGASGDGSG